MRGNPYYVGPFTGGLNTRDSVMELPITHTPDCLNVIGGLDGTIRKRDPNRAINSNFPAGGANDITALFYSETQDKFVAALGAKFYSSPFNGAASTDITGAFAPVVGSRWCFVEAPASGGQGPIYFMQGDAAPFVGQWTGAGNIAAWTASAGTLPTGDFMVYFKNRIIAGGKLVGINGSGIAASVVGDPRNWDTAAAAGGWLTNIDPNDGSTCTGMGVIGSYVVVFKESKTYLIYDTDTGASRLISNSVGLKTGQWRTISQTPYGLVWLAQDGHVYLTDGAKITKLSDIIGEPTSGAAGNLANQATLGFPARISVNAMAAGYYDDKYYVSIAYNNATQFSFVYDFITKAWWRHTGTFYQYANFSSANTTSTGLAGANANISSPLPVIMALYPAGSSNTSGSGFQDFTTSSTNYNAYYVTIPLAPVGAKGVNHNLRKRFHAMRGFIAGTVDIQTAFDVLGSNPPTFSTVQSLVNRPVDFPIENTIYSLGVANNMQFKFTSTDGFVWELHPFQLYTQPRTD